MKSEKQKGGGECMRAILRVDDRLLHGKLSISWTSYLKTDTILIANENAVNDEFTMMSLRLAKPRNVQIIIQDIPDAIAYLRETIEIYFQEIPEHPKIHFQDLQISESRQI